jgi:capsular polysaccharide biosynthesis protein
MAEYGFTILEPERMRVDEVAAALYGANVVAGVEGSQLSHSLLGAADGATMLTLQPPQRFAAPLKRYSEAIGFRWGFLIGEQQSHDVWRVNVDDLRRTLDLLLHPRRIARTSEHL